MSDSNSSLVGSYVALQINAKAMVAEYADSPILALANALGTQKYVALVEKEVQVASCSDEPMWCVYRVSLVGRHTRLRPAAPSPSPEGCCLPIYPASPSAHSTAHAPVRPSQPFPKHDCCHRPGIETLVRVHRPPQHTRPQWTLSDEQMRRVAMMRRKLDSGDDEEEEDGSEYAQLSTSRAPSSATRATIRQPLALAPHKNENYPFAVHASSSSSGGGGVVREQQLPFLPLPLPAPLSPLNPNFNLIAAARTPSPPRDSQPPRVFTPTSHITSTSVAETSVSELFDREKARARHDTMDSASVYSATETDTDSTSTSVIVLLESPDAPTLECDADLDDIPLVDVSFDLSELVVVPDPVGFLEERDVVTQLVHKAETRHRNTPTPSVLSADASSVGAFDAESRRLSLTLARVRSQQSQRTLISSRATSPPTAPPLPAVPASAPARAKLRKARSRSSYRPLPADARSVRSRTRTISGEGKQDDVDTNVMEVQRENGKERKREGRERTLDAWQWLAELTDHPVRVMFKRPALAVRRWVLHVVRRGRRQRETGGKAKATYYATGDSNLTS